MKRKSVEYRCKILSPRGREVTIASRVSTARARARVSVGHKWRKILPSATVKRKCALSKGRKRATMHSRSKLIAHPCRTIGRGARFICSVNETICHLIPATWWGGGKGRERDEA